MYSRIVLTVLSATLCWSFLGSYSGTMAATASGNTSSCNMTSGNMTSCNMTSGNMTSGNMTGGDMTSGNMTGGDMTSGNMTGGDMTSGNMTGGDMTSGNMTGGDMTSGNMTGGDMTSGNMTSGNMTSDNTAPLVTNTTVTTLTANITRDGCGTTRLCAAEPSDCDPSTSGSCSFLSARQLSGQNFELTISGASEGYIGSVLSTDTTLGGNDTTYVCANNNSNVQFFTAFLNNGVLMMTELNVNSVKGKVSGSTIQCTFSATLPNSTATKSTRTTEFSASYVNGTFDPVSGSLGAPMPRIMTGVVNFGSPNASVTNTLNDNNTNTNTTTATPNTTAHAVAVHSSLLQSLLITLVVVGLAMF